jgi:hypothetical protein
MYTSASISFFNNYLFVLTAIMSKDSSFVPPFILRSLEEKIHTLQISSANVRRGRKAFKQQGESAGVTHLILLDPKRNRYCHT